MTFLDSTAQIAGAMYGEVTADGFRLHLPALGLSWDGADTAAAFVAMTPDASRSEVAMAIGQMDLIEVLETVDDHPLVTPEAYAAGIATLRALPRLSADAVDAVLADPSPVLIDVWGPKCTSCVLMAPVVEELHARLAGKVRLFQVDGEADLELRKQLEVQALPTYLLFTEGDRVGYFVGFRGVTAFVEQIEAALADA